MAWKARWCVPFGSLSGARYTVEIMVFGYEGEAQVLTAGPEPFVTQESDDTNVFVATRSQSGKVQVVIDPDRAEEADLLQEMLPENDRSRLVRLVSVDSGTVEWQGFLTCAMYSQPWEGRKHVVELPVQCMVSALECVEIGTDDTGIWRMARVLTHAVGRLVSDDVFDADGVAAGLMGHVYVADDCAGVEDSFLFKYLNWQAFFASESETEEDRTRMRVFGWNWREILEEMCRVFGLTLRCKGRDWYFAAADCATHCRRFSWDDLVLLADGAEDSIVGFASEWVEVDLLDDLALRGAENSRGVGQGRKKVSVVLKMGDSGLVMSPSEVISRGEKVIEVANMVDSDTVYEQAFVQPFYSADTDTEVFRGVYHRDNGDDMLYNAANAYEWLTRMSVLGGVDNLLPDVQDARVTGAMLCRWGYKEEKGAVRLAQGLFLAQKGGPGILEEEKYHVCYTLRTAVPYCGRGGYFALSFNMYNFWKDSVEGKDVWRFGGDNADVNDAVALRFSLEVGGRRWSQYVGGYGVQDGYASGRWTTAKNAGFDVIVDSTGAIMPNLKTSDIYDKEGAYLIPLGGMVNDNGGYRDMSEGVSGVVELKIYDTFRKDSRNDKVMPDRIIANLRLEHIPEQSLGASEATENRYARKTGVDFKGTESISLRLGTYNNNPDNACFLLESDLLGDYLEKMDYVGGVSQRPEEHLLGRMVKYYMRSRWWAESVVDRAMETLHTLYRYEGRRFMAVDSRTEWKLDRKLVRFVEVGSSEGVRL